MGAMEKLRSAAAFYSRGDLASALRDAESAIKVEKNNAGALQFVGVLHCQLGHPDKGVDYFRRALKFAPGDANLRINLVTALIESGNAEEAERLVSESAAAADPALQRVRAQALKALGRNDEAASAYEQVVAANPTDWESWNNLGNIRFVAGDTGGAILALEKARDLNPKSAIVRINLGRFYGALKRHDEALMSFNAAVEADRTDPKAYFEFGGALRLLDRAADSLLAFAEAAKLDRTDPQIFAAMGSAFADLEELPQAEQGFRFALQVDPKYLPAYFDLGVILERQNRIDDLDALLAEAEKNALSAPEIEYLRAVSLRRAGKLHEAYDLARSIPYGAIDEAVRNHFLGQVADQLGDVDTAFGFFVAMNQALRETPLGSLYTGGEYLEEIKAQAAFTTREWVDSWPKVDVPTQPPSPVYLLGFPRSGTTLLDTVLLGHDQVQVLEERPILAKATEQLGSLERLNEVGGEEILSYRDGYFAELTRTFSYDPRKLLVDKNPLATLRLPLIKRLFPDTKIIFTLRHPCDVVLSGFMQNFRPTQSMSSFTDLHQTALVYDSVMSYWEQCNQLFDLEVHTVRYEAMVENLEAEMRPLLEFLGLPWDAKILDHQRTARERGNIRTPSYAQVTEKIYKRAEGRWLRYRQYFTTALPVLQPWIEKFGYSTGDGGGESPAT